MGTPEDLQKTTAKTTEGAGIKPEAGMVSPEVQEKIDRSNKQLDAWEAQLDGAREKMEKSSRSNSLAGAEQTLSQKAIDEYKAMSATIREAVPAFAAAGCTIEHSSDVTRATNPVSYNELKSVILLKHGYRSIPLVDESSALLGKYVDRNKLGHFREKVETAKGVASLFE
jgi:hypothetical protein